MVGHYPPMGREGHRRAPAHHGRSGVLPGAVCQLTSRVLLVYRGIAGGAPVGGSRCRDGRGLVSIDAFLASIRRIYAPTSAPGRVALDFGRGDAIACSTTFI